MQALNGGLVVAEQRLCTEILLRVMEMFAKTQIQFHAVATSSCKKEFCTREGLGTALNSYGFLLRSSVVCSRNRIQYVVTCYADTEPRLTSVHTQKSHSNQLFYLFTFFAIKVKCYRTASILDEPEIITVLFFTDSRYAQIISATVCIITCTMVASRLCCCKRYSDESS